MRTAIVAVGSKHDLLAIRTEHGEGIKTFIAADLFQTLPSPQGVPRKYLPIGDFAVPA